MILMRYDELLSNTLRDTHIITLRTSSLLLNSINRHLHETNIRQEGVSV